MAVRGAQEARDRYGVTVEVAESRAPGDYARYLTKFARRPVGLTIGVGFLMRNAVYTVARQFPKARFALVDASPVDAQGVVHDLPNVASLYFKEQESGYLAGVISGLMERKRVGTATHNTLAYMGSWNTPPVDRYLAGFVAGARRVDPGVRILGDYAQTYTDDSRGRTIGASQMASGADIMFPVAGSVGLAYLQSAQEGGVYGIGVDTDLGYLGPYILTSAVKRVDVAVEDVIHETQSGAFRGGERRLGLAQGATGFAKPSSVVPTDVVQEANSYAKRIARGQIVPPTTLPAH
jgi:basic membrane protein A